MLLRVKNRWCTESGDKWGPSGGGARGPGRSLAGGATSGQSVVTKKKTVSGNL